MFAVCACAAASSETFADDSWKAAWEVRDGFKMEIDTEGFELPSSIAFVPNPGDGPKDPLYFVTELRRGVKVITNDRTVYTFADEFARLIPEILERRRRPGYVPEEGIAGITLDEETGYVFVSFSYYDANDVLRFDIARFKTEPGTFSIKPDEMVRFTDIFANQPGGDSHMIGPMAVVDDYLYVCVGDAQAPSLTQQNDSALGKVLRMTRDGDPVPENPFYQNDDRTNPANYVYAKGFRNPFGFKVVRGEMFINDVGPGVDRFVRIREGGNYYYDGSDMSIASHADIVFTPSPSPVQLDFLPAKDSTFPLQYRERFYTAMSGLQGSLGPSESGGKSIQMFGYDFERLEVIGRPETLVNYRGQGKQMPVGLAFGPNGLYMVALHSDRNGRTPVYRITHEPADPHPFVMDRAATLIRAKGCMGCHRAGPTAPAKPIDTPDLKSRILARVNGEGYQQQQDHLDTLATEPFVSFREARQDLRNTNGTEKARVWLKYQLLEPRFDNPDSMMPNLALTEEEADIIANHLISKDHSKTLAQSISDVVTHYIPHLRQRHLALFFLVGGLAGAMGGIALTGAIIWWANRRRVPAETSADRQNQEVSVR